jgi:hypothetical protein
MADRITRSAPGTKSTVTFPRRRELDLKGSAFNAKGLTVFDAMQGGDYGRELMGDLIADRNAGPRAVSPLCCSRLPR